MTLRTWQRLSTVVLHDTKERLIRESKNWERKIREIESGLVDTSIMQPKREYERRVKVCKEKVDMIDSVLRERKNGQNLKTHQ